MKIRLYHLSTLLTCLLIALVLKASLNTTRAQNSDKPKDQPKCAEQLVKYIDDREKAFTDFLDANFSNEAPNSELLGTAILEYRDFSQDLNRKIQEIYKPEPGKLYESQSDDYAQCVRLAENHRDLAKRTMYDHVLTIGQAKKTLQIVNKYKEINAKLRETVSEMALVQGYFESLNSKVPCYVVQCQK